MKKFLISFASLSLLLSDGFSQNFDLWSATHLVEIKQGSPLSSHVSLYRSGTFELSDGTPVTFRRWFSTNWTDSRIAFMTQFNPQVGLLWGASTGEHGEKYSIAPSLTLGMVFRHEFSSKSSISIKGSNIFGGMLREHPCVADYGEIGGIQQVNCRMAASTLAPSQTLQYLLRDKPFNAQTIFFEYRLTYN